MVQAPVLDGLSFDSFSFQQDGLAAPEVDIGRCQIIQALVIALVIVVRDEGLDLGFEVARQIVVLQQDPVFQGLMPALDLALGLWVIGGAANVLHVSVVEPFGQVTGDIARAVVGQQPRLVNDRRLIAA